MSGPNTLAALRQVRGLMEQVSKMLLSADEMMKAGGWLQRLGNTAIVNGSYTVGTPTGWMPYEIFRFYRHAQDPALQIVVPCITVQLDGENRGKAITEPLICAIAYEYESTGAIPTGATLYNTDWWHLAIDSRTDDGARVVVEPAIQWPTDDLSQRIKRMQSFARPLVAIHDGAALRDLIVQPLLDILSEIKAANSSTPQVQIG
jgi:hypothetical protein